MADGSTGRGGASRTERHIVLVGLPGAGKSTVGRAVAGLLGRRFIDFDAEIVRREGKSVSAIFAEHGEPYFRAHEAELTRELASSTGWVIAPGGGWILQPELVSMMRPVSAIVHLRVSPETALHRMGSGAGERPLLGTDDRLLRLERLWAERKERYQSADVEVNTETLGIEDVARRVIDLTIRTAAAPAARTSDPAKKT